MVIERGDSRRVQKHPELLARLDIARQIRIDDANQRLGVRADNAFCRRANEAHMLAGAQYVTGTNLGDGNMNRIAGHVGVVNLAEGQEGLVWHVPYIGGIVGKVKG